MHNKLKYKFYTNASNSIRRLSFNIWMITLKFYLLAERNNANTWNCIGPYSVYDAYVFNPFLLIYTAYTLFYFLRPLSLNMEYYWKTKQKITFASQRSAYFAQFFSKAWFEPRILQCIPRNLIVERLLEGRLWALK